MEPTQQPPDHGKSTPGTREPSVTKSSVFARARDLSPRARVTFGVVVVAVLLLLAIAFDAGVSSPAVCGACHEMRPWVTSWSVSAHAQVGCYSCHGTPRSWYGAPVSAFERWGALGGDVGAHWSGRSREVTDSAAAGAIPDSTCLQCHDAARVGTSRFGVQIDHAAHVKRNKSCVSCHRWTAHPPAGGDRDALMMLLCFDCHGLSTTAKAPGRCDECHLKGLDLRPDSHKTGKWLTAHGPIAKADRQQCAMCHYEKSCRDCHGLQMPHPPGWAKSGPLGHAAAATKDRAVCEKCHQGTTDLCTMCHHQGFNVGKGPWIKQHPAMANRTGTAFCFQCHDAVFCAKCHSASPGR
jgi:hypothetical protein